jgi:uncharacterized protein with NRDE domain
MCLAIIAHRVHPHYPLILLFNRDENITRPTRPLALWDDIHIYAGQDEVRGGTWLGIHQTGRWALVTNYHTDQRSNPALSSRGWLVRDLLSTNISMDLYLENLVNVSKEFGPFNFLCGDLTRMYYYCSLKNSFVLLDESLYGLSNTCLDTPWPKVTKAKELAEQLLASDQVSMDACLSLLGDKEPQTNSQNTIQASILTSIRVVGPVYATRSSSVILVNHARHCDFWEKTYLQGSENKIVKIAFDITSNSR